MGSWLFRRATPGTPSVLVAINTALTPVEVPARGHVVVATDRSTEGTPLAGVLTLAGLGAAWVIEDGA
jgi:hypothetical protein